MKFEKTCTVSCCDFTHSSPNQYEALEKLMGHIRQKHPDILQQLDVRGRELATCQNGCGYYDDVKSNHSGWHETEPSFKEAWRMNALKEMVKCSDYC